VSWFGEPWPSAKDRAPACEDDNDRIPVPVGQPCVWCHELIIESDCGEVIGTPEGIGFVHIECSMRQVMGGPAHILKICRCCQGGTEDPDMGYTPREAALLVWDHFVYGIPIVFPLKRLADSQKDSPIA
jgi:hypothetical protein